MNLLSIVILGLFFGCATSNKVKKFENWQLKGIGTKEISSILTLKESKNSQGIVLLSPEKTRDDYEISFEVKPNQFKGVLVLLTSVLDKNSLQAPIIPEKYDGNWGHWKSDKSQIQSYAFAVHTSFHQPYAFMKKNPGFSPLAKAKDLFKDENWHQVKIIKRGKELKLLLDDKVLLSSVDENPLPGGHIGLRLRGPGDGSFNAQFRNFVIK